MRYVPNLIPEKSKVLPTYFKGDIYKATKKNPVTDTLIWILGIIFFLTALVFIKHIIMFLLFALLGFILIPPGHRLLEKKLRFKLTTKIKAIATSLLFLASLPLTTHYSAIDKEDAYQQKLLDNKKVKEKAIADQKEQQRKDSLNYYIEQSNQLGKSHKIEAANQKLQYAMAFANFANEKEKIEKEKIGLVAIKTLDLVKGGKYQDALPKLDNLINSDPTNPEFLYNRAICYSKIGKIQEAVNELKPLIQVGNTDAEKLHDKINPIKKRISYYVTRCMDGSTSNAKGRGACSHHGGVKNWNEPVYEEYRKYE
ncbi:MAG TPA: tetratricopeptide repeat protein [Flavobacterium sp.]|jgi:tetratricopeptide (TPR) repeat protein